MQNQPYMSSINTQSLADIIYNCNSHGGFSALVCVTTADHVFEFITEMEQELCIPAHGNVLFFDNHSSIRVISQYDLSAFDCRMFHAILIEDELNETNAELVSKLGEHMRGYSSGDMFAIADIHPDYYLSRPDDLDLSNRPTVLIDCDADDEKEADPIDSFLAGFSPDVMAGETEH